DRPSAKARGAEKPTAGMGLVANRGPMAPQGLEHFLRDIFGAAAFVQEARRSAHGAGPTVLKDTLERFRLHQLLQPPRSQGSGSRLHGSAYRCKRMCSRRRSYIERAGDGLQAVVGQIETDIGALAGDEPALGRE